MVLQAASPYRLPLGQTIHVLTVSTKLQLHKFCHGMNYSLATLAEVPPFKN